MLRDRFSGLPGDADRTPLSGFELLATAALVGATAGLPGLVVGAGLALAWLLLPVVYVVALGQFAVVGLYDAATPTVVLALVEVGLGGVLLASLLPAAPLRAGVAFAVTAPILVGVVLFAPSLPLGAAALLALASIAAYGLHRHQRVSMELVEP